MRQAVLRYATACVADINAQSLAVVPHVDVYLALRWGELQCVGQKVAHNLVDIVRHVGSFYLGLTGHELQLDAKFVGIVLKRLYYHVDVGNDIAFLPFWFAYS